jgi:uncharacterized protein
MNKAVLQRSICEVVDRVVALAHPLRIVLFGSAVDGKFGDDSDLDFLVVIPDGARTDAVADRLNTGVRPRPLPCDFVVVTPSVLKRHRHNPGLVYAEILDKGREVYAT